MTDSGTQRVHEAVRALTSGWTESIEYSVMIEGTVELRVRTRRFDALLDQLSLMTRMPASMGSDGGSNPNKSGSKPPLNQAPANLIDDIHEQAAELRDTIGQFSRYDRRPRSNAHILQDLVLTCREIEPEHPDAVTIAVKVADAWVRRARVMLGYEMRECTLADMVCGSCGGALVVAVDASTDVRCVGAPGALSCGTRYPRWTWISLLEA